MTAPGEFTLDKPEVKPEVIYLPAIFRDIRAGKIRIPAFQRGFVWRQAQVLELLESVYRGFPIGSLLFWRSDETVMQTDTSEYLPFPHPLVEGEVDFVLDGMQRISSLYGAFHERPGPAADDPFAVVFDLAEESFRTQRDKNERCIDLKNLFNPRELLKEQSRLSTLKDGDEYVDRTLVLQRTFQEYLVPVVRISNATPEQVVQIFERVNNTGTKFGAVDFMRALTWSSDFDLNDQLTELSELALEENFEIPSDTIAKSIALAMDTAPTSEEMTRLRRKSSSDLTGASQRTADAISETIDFLRSKLGLYSYDFVPYEGQFLVATSIAIQCKASQFPSWYREWFWTVGFSESLQGRPDHAIARLAIDAREALPSGLPERFSLSKDTLISRAIRKNAALATAFVAALATGPAVSVLSGQTLAIHEMTNRFETSMLGTIFDRDDLAKALFRQPRTDKLISNVVLLGPDERLPRPSHSDLRRAILSLSQSPNGLEMLASQLIDETCVAALRAHDVRRFLEARASVVHARAKELCNVSTQPLE